MTTNPICCRLPRGSLAVRTFTLGLLILAVTLPARLQGQASKALPDVVEEFRRALKLEAGTKEGDVLKYYDTKSTRKQVQYAIEYREKNLQAIAERMTSLGELSKALLLQEWLVGAPSDPAGLDTKIRDAMLKRFADGLRRALASSNPQIAATACALVEEVSANARLQEPKQLDLRRMCTDLVPDLIKQTRNSSVQVQVAAAQALGRVKGLAKDVAPALKRLLASGNEVSVRRAAAQAFFDQLQYLVTQVTMPPRENTRESPLLREPKLRDECRDFSILALQAFSTLPGGGLADPEDPVRLLCTNACGQIASGLRNQQLHENSQVSFPPLDRKLSRADLAFIRQQKEIADENFEFFRPEFKALQDAAPALARVVVDRDQDIRVAAAGALADVAGARRRLRSQLDAIPRNLPKAEDDKEKRKDVELPRFLPNAVPGTDTKTALGQLVSLDKDKEEAARRADEAARDDPVLAEPPETLKALEESLLGSPDERSRIEAGFAIETMGREGLPAIPALIKALCDPSPYVRWGTSRTLGRLAPASADTVVPALVEHLCDDNVDVRASSATALEHFGLLAAPAIPALTKVVGKGDSEVRIAAMKALVAAGSAAATAVPEIALGLSDGNFRVRRQAAISLGQFGTLAREAIPALRAATQDDNLEVRTAAAEALIKVLGR